MPKHRVGIVRDVLSPEMLFAAFNFSKMALDVESGGSPYDPVTALIHRSNVMASVMLAVAFLETSINELFQMACDRKLETGTLTRAQADSLSPIWLIEPFRRNARTLEKYQTALRLLNKPTFDEGTGPYQSAKLATEIRNALVHYVPEELDIFLDPEEQDMQRLEKKLKGKFKTNPFTKPFPVISTREPTKRAEYPFFPERCMSYSCSAWVARACLDFADEFFKRAEIRSRYDVIRSELPTLA